MNWLKRFMIGRYGMDHLTMFLLFLSIILSFIASLSGIFWLTLIGYIIFGIGIYRMLSRNTAKRSMENYRFFMFINPIYTRFLKIRGQFQDRKTHRFYKCPNCKAKLRLPKGKGKITITCPQCNTTFKKKT